MLRLSVPGGVLVLVCHALATGQPAGKLSLKEAVEIALQANPEVVSALRGIDAAHGRFWRGISPPPALLSWSYDYIPAGSRISGYGERATAITQSIDFPVTIALRGTSLSSEADAAEADYRTTALSVSLQVKEAYYGVLAKGRLLQLAEENLAIADDFARKTEVRNTVGEGTHLERLTAKVQRTQARNGLESARSDLRIAYGVLSLALGRGGEQSGIPYDLTDSLVYRPVTLVLDQLVDLAQRSNPQVQSAVFKTEAASVNRTLAWSSMLPGLSISYSRQVQGGNTGLYGMAFGVSLPIWFLFDQRGQVEEAAAAHAIAQSDLRAKRNSVSQAVWNSYQEFTNDDRQVQLCRDDLLPQAQEVYRSALTSFEAGEITYIEFLQARQTLISARSSYIDALFHYNAALGRLEKAVGQSLTE